MIVFLKGCLVSYDETSAIIDVQGVGYRVFLPPTRSQDLPAPGNELSIHTSFVIREQSQTLYGFLHAAERDIYDVLINITGIGPKTGLAIIGHLGINELQTAITQGDIRLLSKVPGIGKKSAERLVLELRGKLPALFPRDVQDAHPERVDGRFSLTLIQDAMSALVNLGYNQMSAQAAIKASLEDLPDGAELPQLITAALSHS